MEFSKTYNRDEFLNFLRRDFLPDDFSQINELVVFATKTTYSKQATKLGVCKSLDLVVYEIKHSGKEDPRVGLSKESFRMLSEEWQSRALVLFVPENNANNYRFSLIEIKLEGDSTTAKIHRKYSNPRRYSYLLGEGVGGYTPNKYLAKGIIADEKDLQERFSVEVLTKAFYSELSDWYAWAIDSVEFPGEQNCDTDNKRIEHRSKNVIRLLTRLLFVWFLKQKKLIPWQLFDEDYLSTNLLKDFNPNLKTGLFSEKSQESKYYRAILQNLFFATLNCPITPQSKEDSRERGFRKDDWYGQGFGEDHLMRYKKLFLNPEHFLELVNERVPFLNGGLFDCLDDKQNKIYIDGFSDNLLKPNILKVPDFLFFGEVQGRGQDISGFYGDKKKSKTDILGLVDILKKYNFTIEENMPFDQEVSLDPELLGKVFENLLASYNPETKTTARKQTGSFYTPREIVQYMVDESLVAHLKRTVGEKLEEKYRKLIQYTDEDLGFTNAQKSDIIRSLQNCKVLDPACGSGAFPVGVLQQMVHILSQLDPYNEIWKDLILKESVRELGSTLRDCTDEERNEVQDDINRNFDDGINRPDYARKLYLIEKCIYGVDIQSIAVQISKLRFFISLVVDQKPTQDRNDNFGIRPLPNLEAKFVAANTLIGLNKGERTLFDDREIDKLQAKLVQASHRIFGAKSNRTKNKYKIRVEELQGLITDRLKALGVVGNEDARLMHQWKMFDQNASSPFFDSEWMFGVSDGFDIVIGNPPYLKEGRASKSVFDGVRNSPYYQGKMDLWYMFACWGLDFLTSKGVLCFIATNNWVTNSGASIMRNKVVEEAKILQLCDFSNFMIFESASIQTMVMLFERNAKDDNYEVDYRRLIGDTKLTDVLALLKKKQATQVEYLTPILNRGSFVDKYITFSSNEAILNKIRSCKNAIYLTSKEIAQGIVFPQDFLNSKNQSALGHNYYVGQGIFALSQQEKDELFLDEHELKLIKPFYTTEQIKQYYSNKNNQLWIIYTDSSFKKQSRMSNYPKLKAHLDKFTDIITSDNKPYGLHRSREEQFFQGEKVIALRKCVGRPLFSYSNFDCYVSQTFNIIKTNRVDMKYLTGLLNSKLIKFWLKNRGKMQGNNYQLDKEPLVAIPIAVPSKEVQTKIATLVDYIIWLKANPDTHINDYVDNEYIAAVFEDIIDAMILEVYFDEINDNELYFNSKLSLIDANTQNAICELYEKLKDTHNDIRNNIKLMPIRVEKIINAINS